MSVSDEAFAALTAERDRLQELLHDAEARLAAFEKPYMSAAFGRKFQISPMRAVYLAMLYRAQGRTVRTSSLLAAARRLGQDVGDRRNNVSVHVSLLRAQLKKLGAPTPSILSQWDCGYYLTVPAVNWLEPFAAEEREEAARVATLSPADLRLIADARLDFLTPRQRVQRVSILAAIKHDVPVHELFGRSRETAIVAARHEVWWVLRCEHQWPLNRIAKIFAVHHATVLAAVANVTAKKRIGDRRAA